MNSNSLCILGRQPLIGLAELVSLYGSDVQALGQQAAILNRLPEDINFKRLGGSLKLCLIREILPSHVWPDIQSAISNLLSKQIANLPAGKVTLGLSIYNDQITIDQITRIGLSIKQNLRRSGRSIRIVPNVTTQLNSAQIIHNHLTNSHGIEIVIYRDGQRTIIAQTITVQNIASYSMRDYNRPKRDARVGMLPPKLAQIMINLAAGSLPAPLTVLDPFCGTGVILQEALLMGYQAYGSDINSRMIDYTKQNLAWLRLHFDISNLPEPILEVKDATSAKWQNNFDIIVSELLLGPPLTKLPEDKELELIRHRCDQELAGFLKNIAQQIPPKTRLCLAVPAWQSAEGQFIRLPSLDHLHLLGYNQPSFVEHFKPAGLIYARSNQRVARELLIITRN
ncbi:MAG: methyltransferase domain-containing protein [Candidatus Saccharimonadales bacterium]|jgi:tRNA (guanine10-N2)-dimethyltransferase